MLEGFVKVGNSLLIRRCSVKVPCICPSRNFFVPVVKFDRIAESTDAVRFAKAVTDSAVATGN